VLLRAGCGQADELHDHGREVYPVPAQADGRVVPEVVNIDALTPGR